MTQSDFDAALVIAYQKASKYYGEEYASTAIESTLKLGRHAFPNTKKVIHYTLRCAKGDRVEARMKRERQLEVEKAASREREHKTFHQSTLHLDMASAVQGLDPDMKQAIEAYYQGESMRAACKYIQANVSANTKYYWLRTILERMAKHDLKDYKP